MLTLAILFPILIMIFAAIIVGVLALPIFSIVLTIGFVFAIVAAIFKFVFGGPMLILIIILALVHFSKDRPRF